MNSFYMFSNNPQRGKKKKNFQVLKFSLRNCVGYFIKVIKLYTKHTKLSTQLNVHPARMQCPQFDVLKDYWT